MKIGSILLNELKASSSMRQHKQSWYARRYQHSTGNSSLDCMILFCSIALPYLSQYASVQVKQHSKAAIQHYLSKRA